MAVKTAKLITKRIHTKENAQAKNLIKNQKFREILTA